MGSLMSIQAGGEYIRIFFTVEKLPAGSPVGNIRAGTRRALPKPAGAPAPRPGWSGRQDRRRRGAGVAGAPMRRYNGGSTSLTIQRWKPGMGLLDSVGFVFQ